MRNFSDELTVIDDLKARHKAILPNTISIVNPDMEELNEKTEQKRAFTHKFHQTPAVFCFRFTVILFTKCMWCQESVR